LADDTQKAMNKVRHLLSWMQSVAAVLSMRFIGAGAAFLCSALIARHLAPEGFGRFFMLFTLMTIVAQVTGPGMDTAIVRFASRYIHPNRDDSLPYFKFMLYMKGIIFMATLGLGFVLAKPLIKMFLADTPAGYIPDHNVWLAFFGGAIVSIWGFAQSYFQAHQQFGRFAGYEFCSASLRLSLVAFLVASGNKNFSYYILAYVTAPTVMAVLSWTQLPGEIFRTPTNFKVGKELLSFGKWVFCVGLFTTLTQRLDLLLLNYAPFEIPKDAIGRYSAAVSLVLAGELVVMTFYSVLLPKASKLKGSPALRQFIRQLRIPSLLFGLAMCLAICFDGLIVKIIFEDSYFGAEVYFSILLLGPVAALCCAPVVVALYSLGQPRAIAVCEGIRMVLTLCIGIYVTPRYGVWGIACVTSGVRVTMALVTYLIAHHKIRTLSNKAIIGEADEKTA
jgi:O-antigen/teichoic acid export membrane protein